MEHLTQEQLLDVLQIAKRFSDRDWLAILLGYNHGLRIQEVCSLTPSNFASGYLTVQRLKGSLKTTQPLIESSNPLLNERSAVEAWCGRFGARQRIFTIQRSMLGKLFEKYARLAGVPQHHRHFSVLKHSLAMHTIQQSGIENVRQYLGHKVISSTGQYLRVDDAQASAVIQRVLAVGKVG
jgi:integrase